MYKPDVNIQKFYYTLLLKMRGTNFWHTIFQSGKNTTCKVPGTTVGGSPRRKLWWVFGCCQMKLPASHNTCFTWQHPKYLVFNSNQTEKSTSKFDPVIFWSSVVAYATVWFSKECTTHKRNLRINQKWQIYTCFVYIYWTMPYMLGLQNGPWHF